MGSESYENIGYKLVYEKTGIVATYDAADMDLLPATMAYFGRLIIAVDRVKRLRAAEFLVKFVTCALAGISTAWIVNTYMLPAVIEQMAETETAGLTEMDRCIAVMVFTAFITICLWVDNTLFELAVSNILYNDGSIPSKNETVIIGIAQLGGFFVMSWVVMQANYILALPILIMAMSGIFRLSSVERKKFKFMIEADCIAETMSDKEKMKKIADIIKSNGKYFDSDLGYELTGEQGWTVNSIVNSGS